MDRIQTIKALLTPGTVGELKSLFNSVGNMACLGVAYKLNVGQYAVYTGVAMTALATLAAFKTEGGKKNIMACAAAIAGTGITVGGLSMLDNNLPWLDSCLSQYFVKKN